MCVSRRVLCVCVCVCVLVLITINLRFCLPFALASNLYANQSKFLIERNEKKRNRKKKTKSLTNKAKGKANQIRECDNDR